MEVWAKIFESNGKQVVVEKGTNSDGNPAIFYRWQEVDYNVSTGPSWKDDSSKSFKQCDKAFELINQESVDNFLSPIMSKINELSE